MTAFTSSNTTLWRVAYWLCFVGWVVGAILSMWKIPAGVLNSYLADVAFPPWFYMVIRGPHTIGQITPRAVRWFGVTPERAAGGIFVVGLVSEITQRFWPRGPFPGTYDPWDIAAYAVGLAICYAIDKGHLRRPG